MWYLTFINTISPFALRSPVEIDPATLPILKTPYVSTPRCGIRLMIISRYRYFGWTIDQFEKKRKPPGRDWSLTNIYLQPARPEDVSYRYIYVASKTPVSVAPALSVAPPSQADWDATRDGVREMMRTYGGQGSEL